MVDIGSITDAELARNGIIRSRESLLLNVYGDTYALPMNWEKMSPAEVLKATNLHDAIETAIMNDGRNPLQIALLEYNKRLYEIARRKVKTEETVWP